MNSRRVWFIPMVIILLVLCNVSLISFCRDMGKWNRLMVREEAMDRIRAQQVPLKLYDDFISWEKDQKSGKDFSRYDYLLAWLISGEEKREQLSWYAQRLQAVKEEQYLEYTGYLASVWEDLRYFPVPVSTLNEKAGVSFTDSWMFERTFGGKRGHEGTDLMAKINERGRYPVVSMTAGVVEKIGWLTKGGYRIGIRSPHGGYFYYAHLYDYAEEFQIGDTVEAGELLGFMGDSGYSEIEGTVGNFDVHLHVGIYVNQPDGTEMSINAYWPLKSLEKKKLEYPFY